LATKPAITRRPWDRQPPHEWPFKPGVVLAFTPGGGQFDSAHGASCDLTTSTQYDIGVGSGGDWRAANWYNGRRSASRRDYGTAYPLALLAVFENGGTGITAHISNATVTSANWTLGLYSSAGQILGQARDSGAVDRSITGPTPAANELVSVVLVWEPGIGLSMSVNGVDYGTTSFTATDLYRQAIYLEEGQTLNARHYLTAWLEPEWIPLRTELSANPWLVYQDRAVMVPVSAGGASHATTGALAGGGAAIAGSAAHKALHPTTGALAGGSSAITGAAARTRAHAASGALAGSGATSAGSAARTRAHPAAGTLAAAGATLAASAARAHLHPSSGVLAGAGAAVAGSAARAADSEHAGAGALAGGGAAVSGTAVHKRLHAAAGVLAGSGAIVVGAAARSGSGVVTYPADRTMVIMAEARTLAIAAESRTMAIAAETRTMRIRA
jgi:hypothetical protein